MVDAFERELISDFPRNRFWIHEDVGEFHGVTVRASSCWVPAMRAATESGSLPKVKVEELDIHDPPALSSRSDDTTWTST